MHARCHVFTTVNGFVALFAQNNDPLSPANNLFGNAGIATQQPPGMGLTIYSALRTTGTVRRSVTIW